MLFVWVTFTFTKTQQLNFYSSMTSDFFTVSLVDLIYLHNLGLTGGALDLGWKKDIYEAIW